MPNILQSDLKSHKSTVGASLNEWGEKQNTITDLTEDKLNELIIDVNYITGINSVWNVVECDTNEDRPLVGEPLTIYYVILTGLRYMWGGTQYILINEGSRGLVTSVAGKIGDVILSKSDVNLGNVDNTSDLTKINTTNYTALNTTSKTVSGAINEVKSSTDSKAPTNNPTLTGTVVLPSTTSIGSVSNTEISYLDGVTSAIQTQLNSKANIDSPTFTGTVVLPNTTSIGNVDSTEISYLDGVTSGIQGQLNNKQPLDSDLTAVADLSSNGIIVKTGSGTASTRSIATSGVGISVTNGDGVSDNPTIVSNATSSNTPDTVVSRNVDGNFNAGTITATLNGSASTLTTPRTIGTMTGDVTSDGSSFNGSANNSNVATIGANKVTNAKLAQMPTMTIKGNDAVGSADPQDLTVPEVQTMIQDTTHRFVTDLEKVTWNSASAGVNTGDIIYRTSNTVPVGYLKANGALISRVTYSDLFSVIGTTFGAGDGSTTFNLPDLRGEFIRAWDDGRGVDTGRALGSWQADEFKSHNHTFGGSSQQGAGGSGFTWLGTWVGTTYTSSTGGTETRPRNIALMAVIKY